MANIKVTSILNNAQTLLKDKVGTRWPLTELLEWFNLGQLVIVGLRPDACTKTETFNTALGTLQQLPAEALRLIEVVRNENGNKKPVRSIARSVLDDRLTNWHDESAPANEVELFVYDDRSPKEFYVYPAPAANVPLKIVYSIAPAVITITNFDTDVQPIGLDDTYAAPLLDYILFRAYSKDTSAPANANLAALAQQSFSNALGVKTQVDRAVSPNSA